MAEKEIKTAVEDFDWDAFENGDTHAGKSREELTKTYDESLNTVKDKEVIEGTIIALNKREAVVNIGYKSDGIIPFNEFRYNPDIKVGDKVEVFIENQEDKKGQLILSHRKARAARSWDRINEALEKDEIIKGYIKCRTKGGMIVDVFGIEAFLPGSQIDVKPIRDYDIYVDKTMEFKVVKINQEFRNVVVSHKALIEAELEQQKKDIIGKLEKGQILEGTVKNITSYGVFIDLGGVDGLIHITDLKSSLYIITVLSFLNSFKSFRESYLVAGDYPHESIYMIQNLFNNWFRDFSFDKMAAAAVMESAVLLVFIVLFQRALDNKDHV